MRCLTILTAAVLLLTATARVRGQDPPPTPSPSSPAPAALARPPEIISQLNPKDFANDLGINQNQIQPRVYPQPQTPAAQIPMRADPPVAPPQPTGTTTTTTTTTASVIKPPMVIHWGGGPASTAVAKWLSTKHTWTLNHLKVWPILPAAAVRPQPAPVATVTTTAVTTMQMAAPAATTVTRYFASEEAPPAPVIPRASSQGP